MTQTGKMKLERGEQGIWDTPSWRLIQPNGFPVADIADSLHPEDQESYAHDILAAVNHCEGYTNEQVEGVSMKDLHATLLDLKVGIDRNESDPTLRIEAGSLNHILAKLESVKDQS